MKGLRVKIGFVSIFLIMVCATVSAEKAQRTKYVLEYKTPEAFLDDFMDLSKKPDQPIKYWAAQLIIFFQSDPQLKPFCFDLAKIVRYKNPRRIGYVFLAHQHLFSQELQQITRGRDYKKIWTALETRTKI